MKKLYYYVHTHWDREWYQPFEAFRTQLVSVVKRIVRGLEDGSLPRFYMDGQSIILDDVLEIVPSLRGNLRAMMQRGKLSAGPWYVLADQLLVGGESLVRNLRYGLDGIRQFGEPAMIGYAPDTFGHTADLPRILQGFGIETAAVWRGVPRLEMGPLFWWYSPDGSKVLAYHLTHGYYQTFWHETMGTGALFESGGDSQSPQSTGATESGALDSFRKGKVQPDPSSHESNPAGVAKVAADADSIDGGTLVQSGQAYGQKIKQLAEHLGSWVGAGSESNGNPLPYNKLIEGALLPIGGDHMAPPDNLHEIEEQINNTLREEDLGFELVSTTLPDFLNGVRSALDKPMTIVQKIEGELRYNLSAPDYARSYLLHGVLSTRLYLKRANRLSEYKLARLVEPLSVLLQMNGIVTFPQDELDYAWKKLLQNHPHDSICGCSVDSVHRQMMTRSERIDQLLDSLLQRASAAVAGADDNCLLAPTDPEFGADRLAVFNVGGSRVSSPVPMEWTVAPGHDKALAALESAGMVQIASRRLADNLFSGWGSVPYYKEVELVKGWIWAADVPPSGAQLLKWPEAVPVGGEPSSTAEVLNDNENRPVNVRSSRMSNGCLEVTTNNDGDLRVTAIFGDGRSRVYDVRHRIRDVADGGDSYNFDPIPEDKAIRARFVSIKPGSRGPLVGSLVITYEIDLPDRLETVGPLKLRGDDQSHKITVLKRSKRKTKHLIMTEVSLKRGVPVLFFETRWDNQASDHRMEVVFETGKAVRETFSENHFSVLKRDHARRGKAQKLPVPVAHEAQPDRFPCQRFFIANGQVFFNTGMPEYGVDDTQVTMTMLRSVSWLSKPRLWTRGGGAGPNVEIPEAACKGLNVCSYGWAPLAVASAKTMRARDAEETSSEFVDDPFSEAFALAELYEGVLWAAPTRSTIVRQPIASLFSTDNSAICPVSMHLAPQAELLSEDGLLDLDDEKSLTRGNAIVRLLNVSSHPQRCCVKFNSAKFKSAAVCNLAGAVTEKIVLSIEDSDDSAGEDYPAQASVVLEFGKCELKTLILYTEAGSLPHLQARVPVGASAGKSSARAVKSSAKTASKASTGTRKRSGGRKKSGEDPAPT